MRVVIVWILVMFLLNACRQPEALPEETVCTIPPPPLHFVLSGIVPEENITVTIPEIYKASDDEAIEYNVLYNDTLKQTIIELDGSDYMGYVYDNYFKLITPTDTHEITAGISTYTCSQNCSCNKWVNLYSDNARSIDSTGEQPAIYF